MSTQEPLDRSRRGALKCLAFGGAGTLFALSGGVFMPFDLAQAASHKDRALPAGALSFVQLSDTHIGFNKEANPDVGHTLRQTIDLVNGMPQRPSLILHTGDITHLSRPEEFDAADQLLSQLSVSELHTVPGEHDVADAAVSQYFDRFGKPSGRKGYYSFDHGGVHFIGLINVLNFKPGGLGALGNEQLEWLERDLKGCSSSTPVVVFAHMPLWTIYEPWGWGTADAERAFTYLRRFGSVTVLNGHIHQIVQKVEGHITFHTARSTAYPQPTPGGAATPGPMKVLGDQLPKMLGLTSVTLARHPSAPGLIGRGSVMMSAVARIFIAAAMLGALWPGVSAEAPVSQTSPAQTITIKDLNFQPVSLTVSAGTSVSWKNLDEEPHTVASATGLFRSDALDQNDRFTFTFVKPGTYRYVCSIHPQMFGTVVVK